MTVSRRIRIALAAPVIAASVALAGCSVVDNVVDGVVDEGSRQVQEGLNEALGEALGGAGISQNGELPPGFPSDAVPTIDGTLIGGGSGPNGSGWAVQYTLESADQYDAAAQLLTDAGYTASVSNGDATSGFGQFTGNGYSVVLTVATEGSTATATYVVTTVAQ